MKLLISTRQLVFIALFGMVLIIAGVVLGYRFFPKIVEDQVWKAAVLKNDSNSWKWFEEIPFPFAFKVYFFDVQNPKTVLDGSKPVLREVGPYVYKLHRRKDFIEIDGDEISYYDYMTFEFDEEASGKLSDEDEVSILNMPLNALIQTVEQISPEVLATLDSVLDEIFQEDYNLFVTKKVREFLFDGISFCKNEARLSFGAKMICKQFKLKAANSNQITVSNDGIYYAYLRYKNGTHIHRFTVKSGIKSREEVSNLVKYNNKSMISTWGDNNSTCNQIRGTTAFRPYLTTNMIFEIFSEDICRTMKMVYQKNEVVEGIKGLRFEIPPGTLNSSNENLENFCYCINKSRTLNGEYGCLKNGVLDMSTCLGAPVILSFPHMLYADKEYISSVEGVYPNHILHDTFVVLQPILGIPLRMAKRVQFNMFIRVIEDITIFQNVTSALIPMLWIEESMVLDNASIGMIKSTLLDNLKILEIIKWTLIAIGITVVVLAALAILYLN